MLIRITPHDRTVLQLLASGNEPLEIATKLRISEQQFEAQLFRLLWTMGVPNKAEVVRAAERRGLLAQ